jgi:hypothetical protein
LFVSFSLILVSCGSEKTKDLNVEKQDFSKLNSLRENKKEFNPSLFNGSDFLTTLISYKSYLNYESLLSSTYFGENTNHSDVLEYYKNIKKYPRTQKNKPYKVVKWERLNDSIYVVYYQFKEFYKEAVTKKIMIHYDVKNDKPTIMLDKSKLKRVDMDAILRDE